VSERADPTGVLVVDKPSGPTSHDVVARLRRVFRTPRVGHAGTLDPMASGVLVALIGEATKLSVYATANDKRYVARVAFGRSTDTLDAEGKVTEERRGPLPSAPAIEAALAALRAQTEQIPPAFSALQRDGKRAYELARKGETVELAPRPIEVRALHVLATGDPGGAELPFVDLDVLVGKGYYVRSLARDLGAALGVPAHLAALRRTASGAFTIEEASPLDAPERLEALLVPLADATKRILPSATLTEDGFVRARQGKRLAPEAFIAPPPTVGPSAWFAPGERALTAIGEAQAGEWIVLRGFRES
jgi:tRNA pseudouridine55 synthase